MAETGSPQQAWELATDTGQHRVEVYGSLWRRLRWYVDDELVAEKKSMDDRVRLTSRARPDLGVVRILTSIVTVLVSLLLGTVQVRFAFSLPSLPLPHLDLPDLPIPDFPGIPLPEWSLPGWVRSVLEYAKYVAPIVIAAAVALSEVARRRKQDELRARRSARGDGRSED